MNILLVDDDYLVLTSLKTIIELDSSCSVIATGSNGIEAIALYKKHKPDVLLMDIQMNEMNGLDAARRILEEFSNAKILLLTTFSDDEYIIRALSIGTKGYILKQDYNNIIPALKAVFTGQTVFGQDIISKIPNLLQSPEHFDYSNYDINSREFDVIKLVANGLNNKEIASELFLSEGTIRNYLSSVLEKLNLRDRTQLAVFYYQHL